METESQFVNCFKSTTNHQNQEVLIASIEKYKTQLDEVSAALESASEENKPQLKELQFNLFSILELTLNQLDQCQKKAETSVENVTQNNEQMDYSNSDIDEEFKRFQLEIANLEDINIRERNTPEEGEDDHKFTMRMKKMESSLKLLEGQNVRASYKEQWGGYSYHNAFVLSLVPHSDRAVDFDNPEVIVLFSQPTCLAMMPCRFFLKGHCKFEDGSCKFSHGYRLPVKDLMEYKDPDRDALVSGSRALALHDGHDIWHRGTVEDVLEGRTGFSFNCSHCVQVVEVDLEAMVPVFADEEVDTITDNRKHEEMPVHVPSVSDDGRLKDADFVLNNVLLKPSLSTHLGDWERHTKGIGSKLMAKMGYVMGTGLGRNGEGRVDPVAPYIYPQGLSLDYCMHLRESSNGGCVIELNERLLNKQKKLEERKKRRNRTAGSVFDIINNKLNNTKNGSSVNTSNGLTSLSLLADKPILNVNRSPLKKDSVKELRRKNLALGSRIDKLKSEVVSLKKSRVRHEKDTATLKLIDSQVNGRLKELSALQKAEQKVELEQQNRKDVQKLLFF